MIEAINSYNPWRQEHIRNLIKNHIIELYDDHDIIDDLFFHFKYKDIEVKSNLNAPYPYKKVKVINTEPDDYELIDEDSFRNVVIYMDIKGMLNAEGDYDDEDLEDDETILDEDDEDNEDYESYDDKLRRHFPGLYMTDKQIAAYDSANNKKELLHDLMMKEEFNVFVFSSIRGLKIFDDRITFDIPYLTKPQYEWMFYCCTIIDKVNKYFSEIDEDYDDEDSLDEEWSN